MKILVVGGGGREHAICWKLLESTQVDEVICAPGNGGISQIAKCFDVSAMDIDGMIALAKNENVDLVFVAPDDPLSAGMVDAMENAGIRAFGPSKKAAQIESSKSFSKDLMKKYNIPTAEYEVFESAEEAKQYIISKGAPIVVKADGLALGKGVYVCTDTESALRAVDEIIVDRKFGSAGAKVVIEEFMEGPEVSLLCFCDSKTIKPMVSSQDHKRAYDGDEGPNTGGMGAFSPSPEYTDEIQEYVEKTIMIPTMEAMNKEDCPFKGILYIGLMLTAEGPKVLEYNARFGDPETQVVLPLLDGDLFDIINAIIDEKLDEAKFSFKDMNSAVVVMASGGYPLQYEKGCEITGLDKIDKNKAMVFHAGTTIKNNQFFTSGGRVLGVTAVEKSMKEALLSAYSQIENIHFDNAHYRTDIGIKQR
ncbi:MAG: phosphoribosylamine--glycine ligase [Clostridia bacterium]|nr:phosphoribosylamine--glycine ligase [Clostridia bacterium]